MATAEHYNTAWRDRRRRAISFYTLLYSGIPIMLGSVYLCSTGPGAAHILPPEGLLVIPAWLVADLAAGIWLNRFRCPRCGKFFYWRLEWQGYLERQKNSRDCRWCGLHQGAIPAWRVGQTRSANWRFSIRLLHMRRQEEQ